MFPVGVAVSSIKKNFLFIVVKILGTSDRRHRLSVHYVGGARRICGPRC